MASLMNIKLLRDEINHSYHFFLALEVYSIGLLAIPLVYLYGFSSKTMEVFISSYAPLLALVTILFLFVSAVKKQQLVWSVVWMVIYSFVCLSGLSLLFVTEVIYQSSYATFSTLLYVFETSISLWWLPVAFMLLFLAMGAYIRQAKYFDSKPKGYNIINFLYTYNIVNIVFLFGLVVVWMLLTQGLLPVQIYYIGSTPLITILAIFKLTMSILGLILSGIGFFSSERNFGSVFLYLMEISFLLLSFYVFGIVALVQ